MHNWKVQKKSHASTFPKYPGTKQNEKLGIKTAPVKKKRKKETFKSFLFFLKMIGSMYALKYQ